MFSVQYSVLKGVGVGNQSKPGQPAFSNSFAVLSEDNDGGAEKRGRSGDSGSASAGGSGNPAYTKTARHLFATPFRFQSGGEEEGTELARLWAEVNGLRAQVRDLLDSREKSGATASTSYDGAAVKAVAKELEGMQRHLRMGNLMVHAVSWRGSEVVWLAQSGSFHQKWVVEVFDTSRP